MREHHAHLFQHGRAMEMLDLANCDSPAAVLDLVAGAVRDPTRTMVLAQGARPESWSPSAWPSLAEIDRVTGDRIFVAWCFDYHALLANSAAMRHAGITHDTPDPESGLIGRDENNALTGVMYEHAALKVWESVPEGDDAERERLLRLALADLARHGFTEAHDLKAQTWLGTMLAKLHRESALPMDCVLWPLMPDLDHVVAHRCEWESDTIRLGGGKIFVDGTLNSRTAWMLHPFADGRPEHPNGLAMMTPAEIEDAVRRCDALGVPLAAHAIGDGAVRAVLDAIETVRPTTPGFRIEHAELVDPTDVPRFVDLGVVCSVQPCHVLVDIEALGRAVPDRLDRVLPLRKLIDAGCEPGMQTGPGLIFGSDTPIVRPEPEDSLLAATMRRHEGMAEGNAIGLGQAISREEAERCFGGP